jgi:transcriptional regulator with XRE-family HTH domain
MTDHDAVKRGRWLRNERKRQKLTQSELGKLAGTNDKTVRQMEKGRTEHPWTLPDVMAALGVTEADMDRDNPRSAEDEIDDETLREMLETLRRYPAGVFHALVVWGAFLTRMSEPELTQRIAHVSVYLADERP